MAKKFLESIGEAYGDDVLADLIPKRETKRSSQKKTVTTAKPAAQTSNSNRKKRFLDNIDQQMQNNRPERKSPKTISRASGRKSFLDTIEEALDNHIFDDIIPEKPSWHKEGNEKTEQEQREAMERFSTMITKEVLDRAREIAKQKGIRVKDVINIALQYYVEKEG